MRLRNIRILICLLLPLLFFFDLTAQDIRIKYLGIEDGLSNNAINAIFQDHNGFMWFGTYDGLNRYDGYGFKTFRNIIGDSTSINSNAINTIAEDSLYRLWIGCQKDVNIYDPVTGKFSTPKYLFYNHSIKNHLDDNVMAIKRINGMFIGTQHNGLFWYNNSGVLQQVPILKNNKNVVNYYVSAIEYNDLKKIVYVFVQQQGLFIYDAQEHVLILKNDQIKIINCLKIDSNQKLWLGGNNGLFCFNETSNTYSEVSTPSKFPVVGISEDKKGTLWIASDGGGVWLLDDGGTAAVSLASNNKGNSLINSNAVYAIYIDNAQRKWIGTLRGGVNIIEPSSNLFRTIIYRPGSSNNTIQNFILSFCEDENKNVWIGTDGAGLRYWNRTADTYQDFSNIPGNKTSISSNFITGIVKDESNNIWISTWRGGINRFSKSTNSFQQYSCINSITKSADNNVWFLFEDSKKTLWAGAVRNGGLYKLNKSTNQFECFDASLPELQCMAEDADGNLWAGNYSSLILIDTVNKKHRYYNIGYAVRCIHEDAKKNFWIGTQEGGLLLFNRDKGTFKRYTTTDGLPSNTILRMLEDKHGNLWLGTYNGLSRFDVKQQKIRNFSQADGLQSNQFSYNGALALSTGEFLFGGIKGFNIFFPDSIISKKTTPPVFLSSIKVNNSPLQDNLSYIKERNLEQVKKIVVPYDEASLSLDFLGLDYSNAEDLNYAYKLSGWDKRWNFVNHSRNANYSRLQEGNYVFEVEVNNSGETWSTSQKLLYITVLPPWYRTWWAYTLYILLGASLIYLYVWYKNRQTKLQYEVQLAHLETQKEKELNEKKISFFTNISHEFRAPLSLIINPIKDLLHKSEHKTEKAELKVVYRNAQRLLRLVDHLLLFKKADEETDKLHLASVNFYNVCNDVFICFAEQARSKKIHYELSCADHLKNLIITLDREKIEIALFNILSNAFKYTPIGGEIIFIIEDKNSNVFVSVSDTGTGISAVAGNKIFERFYQSKEENIKSGFGIGLFLVKNFAEAHGGHVSYASTVGKGTTFTIELPKNISINTEVAAIQGDHNVGEQHLAGSQPENSFKNDEDNNVQSGNEEPGINKVSEMLQELNEDVPFEEEDETETGIPEQLASSKQTLLLIDDDDDMRNYLAGIFKQQYKIYTATTAETGIELAHKQLPDLIISDVVMKALNGIDLCLALKQDKTVSHIPIILLTGSSSTEIQLEGIESGADDFIRKPFDKDILVARVSALLKRRNVLQDYFYNEITLGNGKFKVSAEYKDFLEQCMKIIEDHLTDDKFSIKILSNEIGMSHSALYKKIKTVSGQSINGFIRFVRLKKAAEIFINTESNVNETANIVGFYDVKYFRRQFASLFGLNPSEYIKKFRNTFHNNQSLEEKVRK